MLHAYYVLRKRLQRIQAKNSDFLALLIDKFPFLDPTAAPSSPHPLAALTPFQLLSPRSFDLLSPRTAARLTVPPPSTSLASALYLLSTRCLRLQLLRNQPLVSPGDASAYVYLVASGSLVVQRPSSVPLHPDADSPHYPDFPYASLHSGDDVGLFPLISHISSILLTLQRSERLQRQRAKAEEDEWEHMKRAGTRDPHFLQSRKSRLRQQQRRAILSTPPATRPLTAAKADPLLPCRLPGPPHNCRVVAREASVLYAVPRWALVEALKGQASACVRMRRFLEEKEAWRERRWTEDERVRADDARRRAEAGEGQSRAAHPAVHRFPSWQSLHTEERERDRERREKARREEERKRKMDEAMLALNHTSKAMMEAVDGEGAGLGWQGGVRTREETDAGLIRVRVEAQALKDAMNKQALINMFKAKTNTPHPSPPPTALQPFPPEAEGDGEGEGGEEEKTAGEGEGEGKGETVVARGSVSLPRLRLELLPPPSLPSTVSSPGVEESDDGSPFASPSASDLPSSLSSATPLTPHLSARLPCLPLPQDASHPSHCPLPRPLPLRPSSEPLGSSVPHHRPAAGAPAGGLGRLGDRAGARPPGAARGARPAGGGPSTTSAGPPPSSSTLPAVAAAVSTGDTPRACAGGAAAPAVEVRAGRGGQAEGR